MDSVREWEMQFKGNLLKLLPIENELTFTKVLFLQKNTNTLAVCCVQEKNQPAIQMKKTKLRSNPATTAARVATKTTSRTSIQLQKKNQKPNDRSKESPPQNRRTAATATAPTILSLIIIFIVIITFTEIYGTTKLYSLLRFIKYIHTTYTSIYTKHNYVIGLVLYNCLYIKVPYHFPFFKSRNFKCIN